LRGSHKRSAWIVDASIVDGEVLAFLETQRLQLGQECLILGGHVGDVEARAENADAPDLAGLLRPRRERPCGRAADKCDELAAFHCQRLRCFQPRG
jgi:hypothetical protein